MSIDNDEQKILDFFNSAGFEAVKIPECSEESPDFLINDGGYIILVELKTKMDDPDQKKQLEEKLNQGEKVEKFTVLNRKNRLSGIIKKASSQLDAKKKKYNADFCFAFFLVEGIYSSENISRFQTTLYGDKDIIDQDSGNIKKCYYYTNSDFYNYRYVLDGAFIFTEREAMRFIGRLCLNSLSPNYNKVVTVNFVNKFKLGVVDPNVLESSNQVYILDGEIDRKNEEMLINYLQKKYSLSKIIPFNWPQISVLSQMKF